MINERRCSIKLGNVCTYLALSFITLTYLIFCKFVFACSIFFLGGGEEILSIFCLFLQERIWLLIHCTLYWYEFLLPNWHVWGVIKFDHFFLISIELSLEKNKMQRTIFWKSDIQFISSTISFWYLINREWLCHDFIIFIFL